MMKKLLSMILALLMVMSLWACGGEEPKDTKDDLDYGNEVELPGQDTTEDGETDGQKVPPELKSIDEFTFTLNGVKFHLGMKLSELMDSGAFVEVTSRDDTLEAVRAGTAEAKLDENHSVWIDLWNLSRDEIEIKDATVVGLHYHVEDWDESAKAKIGDVSYLGKRLNTSIESVSQVFGEAFVHEETYEMEDERSGGWRGYDIGEEFRLYIRVMEFTDRGLYSFRLEFRPFTDNIK